MRQNAKLIAVASVPPPTTTTVPKLFVDDSKVFLGYESFEAGNEMTVILTFNPAMAHSLGPPNDETLSSHPLSSLGLESYSVQEVIESSWILTLEKSGALRPNWHAPGQTYRHFVITFHDCTFECLAISVELLSRSATHVFEALWQASSPVR
jgi:hypothetical protein